MFSLQSRLTLGNGTSVNTIRPIMKRLVDITIALPLLIVLSPVLLAIWIAIRLDSEGPAIFRQERVGKDGANFIMLKFRTMSHNAPDLRNPDNSTFNSDADPRLTRLGGVLRRTSLDELPQLVNVVRGEMSLIGPRPELPEGPRTYLPHQFARLEVRPGMTGWAAVNGRNDLPMHVRRDMDAWYAQNWTLGLDAKIFWRTLIVVLLRRGIHADAARQDSGLLVK
jgi:undecaprenyl phosphate N,N'-diacetylbacillosamine 1-phosphate transferase